MCITDQLAVFSEARLRFALLFPLVFEVRADGGRELCLRESQPSVPGSVLYNLSQKVSGKA